MRVALLEDEPDHAALVTRALDNGGHSHVVYSNGARFQQAMVRETFDVLILDWMMPDISGLEVLDWLLKEGGCDLDAGSTNGSTPLMMALGYGSPDAAERLVKAGARLDLKNDLGLSAWDFARKVGRDALAERLGVPRPAGAQPSGSAAQPERY